MMLDLPQEKDALTDTPYFHIKFTLINKYVLKYFILINLTLNIYLNIFIQFKLFDFLSL
jgi:hypothetical protein